MKKVKILQILEATTGGTKTHIKYLIQNIDKKKTDITLIYSLNRETYFIKDIKNFTKNGINTHNVAMDRKFNPIKDTIALYKIFQVIKEKKFDIIHLHSSKAGFLGRIAAYMFGIKKIYYTPHAFAFLDYPYGLRRFLFVNIERILSLLTTKIICVSDSEKKIAIDYKIACPQKLLVIPNAIPIHDNCVDEDDLIENLYRDLNILKKDKIVGTVGHFRKQKGYSLFLKVAELVIKKNKNIKFIIVGNGKEKLKLQQMIDYSNLSENIKLMGYIEDIKKYYQFMDIYVSTSKYEGLPYSIIEAMSWGKPIIATNVPGNNDIIEDKKNGYLVDNNDPLNIADIIIELLHDSQKIRVFAENNKLKISEKYNMNEWIENYNRLYLDIKDR